MMEFKLNEAETQKVNEFLKKHRHPEIYKGAIGGHINFIFTPTSVGDACSMHCNICDAEEDITDYTHW